MCCTKATLPTLAGREVGARLQCYNQPNLTDVEAGVPWEHTRQSLRDRAPSHPLAHMQVNSIPASRRAGDGRAAKKAKGRCRCGFSLALTPGGAIWWLRTTKDSMEIKSFKLLLRALNSNCWAHPRPELLKHAVVSPPAVAGIATKTSAPVAVESASSVLSPASLETPGKSKAQDHAVPAPMPPVPPAKRRRTYVPNDTTRTTRSQPNPTGR